AVGDFEVAERDGLRPQSLPGEKRGDRGVVLLDRRLHGGELVARAHEAQLPQREVGLHVAFGQPLHGDDARVAPGLEAVAGEPTAQREADGEQQAAGDPLHGASPAWAMRRVCHAAARYTSALNVRPSAGPTP